MKRPAFQFYPADWRKDPALSTCSFAARGLWIELMCVMHESDRYGVLAINDKPMSSKQIARSVGESHALIGKLLAELEESNVFSRDAAGCIFSRRMVKDERLRNIRADAGRLGGNPDLVKQKDNQKDEDEVKQTDKQSPTPSSSSSSSVFLSDDKNRKADKPKPVDWSMPDWLPRDRFEAFIEHRRELKRPMTHEAKRLFILKLERFRGEGEDVVALLESAIESGYLTVFKAKKTHAHGPPFATNRPPKFDPVAFVNQGKNHESPRPEKFVDASVVDP